jgi:NDP-sugar pyrophosphorylase family protein
MSNCKEAVILAGGKGTRLRPYTVVLPKPLMPIGDMPILEVIIRQLAKHGFSKITLAVNHQAEIIKAFFHDGEKWGIKIEYSNEDRPLGTMAPLRNIQDLPENFLVMNGDILTNLNYSKFFDEHVLNKNIFTISSYSRKQSVDYGVLVPNENRLLQDFIEKPTYSYEVSMGIYMMSKSALKFIPQTGEYGFDKLMLDLIAAQQPAAVRKFDGYWLDIGRPDDYAQAIDEFDRLRESFIGE